LYSEYPEQNLIYPQYEILPEVYSNVPMLSTIMTDVFSSIGNELIQIAVDLLPIVLPVIGILIAVRVGVNIFTLLVNGEKWIQESVDRDCDDYIKEARRNEQLERYGYFDDGDSGTNDTESFWDDSSDWDTSDTSTERLFSNHSLLDESSHWEMSDDLDPNDLDNYEQSDTIDFCSPREESEFEEWYADMIDLDGYNF